MRAAPIRQRLDHDPLRVVGLVATALGTQETELVLLFDEQGLLRKFKLRR